MTTDNDIVERLRALSRCEHSDLSVGDEAAAEIGRLRGEVAEMKARRAEDVSILDDIRDAIGGGPYDTIAKRIRKAIAPAEAKDPAPAMPNGVEGLSPIYGQVPTVEEARTAIGTALDDAAKALRVLSTMLKKEKLMQGYAVADEILGRLGYATKLNAALAQQPAACRCVDCGGDQPGHDPHCANMREIHGTQPADVDGVLTPTGTFCSVCEAPQHNTPSGVSCPTGHGGAEPLTAQSKAVDGVVTDEMVERGVTAYQRTWDEHEARKNAKALSIDTSTTATLNVLDAMRAAMTAQPGGASHE